MRTTYKQTLTLKTVQEIEVEKDSEFIHAGIQMGNLCIWYKCTPDAPKVKRKIYIHGTGHEIIDPTAEYINTLITNEDQLVIHIFVGEE